MFELTNDKKFDLFKNNKIKLFFKTLNYKKCNIDYNQCKKSFLKNTILYYNN